MLPKCSIFKQSYLLQLGVYLYLFLPNLPTLIFTIHMLCGEKRTNKKANFRGHISTGWPKSPHNVLAFPIRNLCAGGILSLLSFATTWVSLYLFDLILKLKDNTLLLEFHVHRIQTQFGLSEFWPVVCY